MPTSTKILGQVKLGFPWPTPDPFLFCVHHLDHYPAGNGKLGPAASLEGRDLGSDFQIKDGWRMYHGESVPGFPQHPHRGFETVTVVKQGLIDHSDSLGATARFGGGDTQWLTAGKGIVHSEMFPLVQTSAPNTLELFQIWLNLPAADKMAEPHFAMLWHEEIPVIEIRDEKGRLTQVTVVAGHLGDAKAPPPPPRSWAANPEHDVAIWTVRMDPHAAWTLPPSAQDSHKTLYFFRGKTLTVDGDIQEVGHGLHLQPDAAIDLVNGDEVTELLLLQGKPIAETVVQYGPFVMNSRQEIEEAFADYQKTGFGGWPWSNDEPAHSLEAGRFAQRPGGELEKP